MNALDITILAFLIVGFYRGFRKGLFYSLALFFAFILGLIGGFQLAGRASVFLSDRFQVSSVYLPFISFFVVFVGVIILVILLAKLLDKALKMTPAGIVNQLLGGLLGSSKFLFLVSSVLWIFGIIETRVSVIPGKIKNESVLYPYVYPVAPYVFPVVKQGYGKLEDTVKSKLEQKKEKL